MSVGAPRDVVLVVEDNRSTAEILCEILRDEALEPVWRSDGSAALAWLRAAGPPCLVLLDLFMPGVSGFDLLQHLRDDPALRRVPVVVISAADRSALARARSLHPGVEVLPKPLDLEVLVSRARACASR